MARLKLSKDEQKQLRSIIKEYYGNNTQYFIYSYANQIYNIPEVRTAISRYAQMFSVIPMYHKVVSKTGNVQYYEDKLSYNLNIKPNALENHSQFTEAWITQLMLEANVFIEPLFDKNTGQLTEMYILPFKYFQFTLEEGAAYVTFHDQVKNTNKKYNMKDLIYLNRFSQPSGGTRSSLGLYETVIEALGSQIVNIAKPNKVRALLQSVVNGTGQLKEKDKKGTMASVKASFDETVEGVAYLDKQWNITPINWQENDVNRALMQFVINIVYSYFQITEKIINFTASEIEIEQFIKLGGLQPLAKQYSDELTAKLFTQRELDVGHRIETDVFALNVYTLSSLTNFFTSTIRSGILNIDEAREYIGQPPLPNGLGQMYRTTGDTMSIDLANQLQSAKAGIENKDKSEEKEVLNDGSN